MEFYKSFLPLSKCLNTDIKSPFNFLLWWLRSNNYFLLLSSLWFLGTLVVSKAMLLTIQTSIPFKGPFLALLSTRLHNCFYFLSSCCPSQLRSLATAPVNSIHVPQAHPTLLGYAALRPNHKNGMLKDKNTVALPTLCCCIAIVHTQLRGLWNNRSSKKMQVGLLLLWNRTLSKRFTLAPWPQARCFTSLTFRCLIWNI